ncbi:hypothetical protein GCM10027566_14960 [Arachidicoccus ginsenosidivorans]|uniref:Colicin E3-like ribonuclease domain-containing protein n=1 Tax=Arachidicoccus ginsenosidivorans TaxID=496057 RepID=A0A5B8VIA0_9BACT|nr:hypothetical protein FSB73_04340 [Arachidicoccus ginsenosidivorans]
MVKQEGKGSLILNYNPAPSTLKAYPDAGKGRFYKPSGRKRWRMLDGSIFEWDYQHGRVEKYNKTGKYHLGVISPV